MRIRFETPSVGALCNSGRKLVHALGIETAEIVMDLLFYLDAAPTLADLSEAPPVLRDQIIREQAPLFTVGVSTKTVSVATSFANMGY